MRQFCHIAHRQFGHIFHRFHQQHGAIGKLAHGTFHFGVAFVANHNDLIALRIQPIHFFVHFGNQRASGIKHAKTALRRFVLHRFGNAVGGINQRGACGHIGQIFNKHRAFFAQVVDHKFIVHHFMAHINRRTEAFDSTLNNADGAIHPGAKAARIGQKNGFVVHNRLCIVLFRLPEAIPILQNKITRRRAEDSTNSTARRANAVRLFCRMGIIFLRWLCRLSAV